METKTAKENLREKFHSYFTYLDGELETQWRGSSHPAQVFDFFWKEIEAREEISNPLTAKRYDTKRHNKRLR